MKTTNNKRIMSFIRWVAKLIVRLEIIGYDLIPQNGAFLVTTSHISRLDTPLLMISTPREDVIGLVARDYQKRSLFKWLLNAIGVIWVSRDETDFAAFREAVSYLNKGWIVGIAPEGTRSRNQKLLEGKSGAALLAQKAKVPIVPAAVTGSADMLNRLLKFKKMRVQIRFGKAYYLPEMPNQDHKEWLKQSTDEIMCRIAVLLPEKHWGFYAESPRLKELLEEKIH